jgi:hypothetical protein
MSVVTSNELTLSKSHAWVLSLPIFPFPLLFFFVKDQVGLDGPDFYRQGSAGAPVAFKILHLKKKHYFDCDLKKQFFLFSNCNTQTIHLLDLI